MDIKYIFLYNIISAIWVLLLILWHTYISISNIKKWFWFAATWSLIVAISSYFLESYPIVLLNIIWFIISIYWFLGYEKSNNIKNTIKYKLWITWLITIISSIAIYIYFQTNNNDYLAYNCTFIYIFTYFLFSLKFISKKTYLFWWIIWYFFIILHLFEKFQYSVLVNETIWVIIWLTWLTKIYLNNTYKLKSKNK